MRINTEYDTYMANKERNLRNNSALYNMEINSRESIREQNEINSNQYIKFKDSVKRMLIEGFMYNILKKTIDNPSDFQLKLSKNIINNYINERGAWNLLDKMISINSPFMIESSNLIQDTYDKIMNENCETNNNQSGPYTVSIDDEDEFYEELEKETDINNISHMIAMRVTNAEQEFINRNIEDKLNIKELLDNTAEKISNMKKSNSLSNEEKNNVEESYSQFSNIELQKMKKREKNLYEQMIFNLSKLSLSESKFKEYGFIDDNGKLNFDLISESVNVFYSYAEMLNSIHLESFSIEDINNLILFM